jgi:aryl-alcohol dehydrogenase-like predicted oxidoreductase
MGVLRKKELGQQGFMVSELGLVCMGMSDFYCPCDDAESIAAIHRAFDLEITFFDIADMYGVGRNEELVGKALQEHRD